MVPSLAPLTALGLIAAADAQAQGGFNPYASSTVPAQFEWSEEQALTSSSALPFEEDEYEYDPAEDPPDWDPSADSMLDAQFAADPHADRDHMEMILAGELGLAGIRYTANSFAHDEFLDTYTEVYGEFCDFDPNLNKEDPPYYPTAGDVMSESRHCGEHRYSASLNEVMYAIGIEGGDGGAVRTLPVAGMMFHQGHAGAGLVANAVTTLPSAEVISEHAAIESALGACDTVRNRYGSDDCLSAKRDMLVRDVVALLSRTTNPNVQKLYLKLGASSAAYIPDLARLFPDVAWTFSHRPDPAEALSKNTKGRRGVTCKRERRNPSKALSERASDENLDLESMSDAEVCALRLSAMHEVATREAGGGRGMLVPYDARGMPNLILNQVFPHLGVEVTKQDRKKIMEVLSSRSNTRNGGRGNEGSGNGGRGNEGSGNGGRGPASSQWDASQEGNDIVSEEVRAAASMFMCGANGAAGAAWEDSK